MNSQELGLFHVVLSFLLQVGLLSKVLI